MDTMNKVSLKNSEYSVGHHISCGRGLSVRKAGFLPHALPYSFCPVFTDGALIRGTDNKLRIKRKFRRHYTSPAAGDYRHLVVLES